MIIIFLITLVAADFDIAISNEYRLEQGRELSLLKTFNTTTTADKTPVD